VAEGRGITFFYEQSLNGLAWFVLADTRRAHVYGWAAMGVLHSYHVPAGLAAGHKNIAVRTFGQRSPCRQPAHRNGRQEGVAVVQHSWFQELPAPITSNCDPHNDWTRAERLGLDDILKDHEFHLCSELAGCIVQHQLRTAVPTCLCLLLVLKVGTVVAAVEIIGWRGLQ
jgi:hypothetical protein